jgi:hypothetical protein
MDNRTGNTFDPIGDVYEIGLMAAASPAFVESLVRAMLEARQDAVAASEPCDTATAPIAA